MGGLSFISYGYEEGLPHCQDRGKSGLLIVGHWGGES